VVPLQLAGATDASLFRVRGIAAYGFSPAILPAGELERIHGIDERISLDNLVLGAQVVYDVVRALCVEA
jgi:acetylornithine deacetylase/succinyl-diaminopimelate desuccinylase-like protein